MGVIKTIFFTVAGTGILVALSCFSYWKGQANENKRLMEKYTDPDPVHYTCRKGEQEFALSIGSDSGGQGVMISTPGMTFSSFLPDLKGKIYAISDEFTGIAVTYNTVRNELVFTSPEQQVTYPCHPG
jgi:hypothetical protein